MKFVTITHFVCPVLSALCVADKAGLCPPVRLASYVGRRPAVCLQRNQCKRDRDCPGRKKCCAGPLQSSCRRCTCPPVLCRLFCRYGFKRDKHGCELCQCNPAPGPLCRPACLNGATCTRANTCQCAAGYTGSRCETEIAQGKTFGMGDKSFCNHMLSLEN